MYSGTWRVGHAVGACLSFRVFPFRLRQAGLFAFINSKVAILGLLPGFFTTLKQIEQSILQVSYSSG